MRVVLYYILPGKGGRVGVGKGQGVNSASASRRPSQDRVRWNIDSALRKLPLELLKFEENMNYNPKLEY